MVSRALSTIGLFNGTHCTGGNAIYSPAGNGVQATAPDELRISQKDNRTGEWIVLRGKPLSLPLARLKAKQLNLIETELRTLGVNPVLITE